MRIVFMGTPDFAVASLDAINKSRHEVVGVVTNIDKKSGRGQKTTFSPVKKYALEHNLHILQPEKFKNEEFLNELKALNADLFVVVAFRMLPEVVWSMPPKGTINLHGSILPDYRGAAPLNWAINNGDKETGVSTFFIEKEIDTGKVIDIAKVPIGENTTAGELHDTLMVIGAETLLKTLDKIEKDNVEGIPQSELVTGEERPAPKIFKDTCQIDWSKTAQEIHNLIRGLSPYPASWTNFTFNEKKHVVKIFETRIVDENIPQGRIKTDNKKYLYAGTGNNRSISILSLQLPGKKRVDIASFLNGFKLNEESDFFE